MPMSALYVLGCKQYDAPEASKLLSLYSPKPGYKRLADARSSAERTPRTPGSAVLFARRHQHTGDMGGALIEDLDGNHCAVADCLDPGDCARSPEARRLLVDVWLCSYHAGLVREGVEDVRFTPPRS